MYISVIPLHHSLSRHPYTYFVGEDWQEDVSLGYLVEIPLGKHITEGIIAKLDVPLPENITPEDIRAIIKVIASIEIVAPYMISLIIDIAERYFLLIHKVASMFLPAPLLSKLDKKNYLLDIPKNQEERKKPLPVSIHHYIDSLFSPDDMKAYLLPETVIIFPDDIMLTLFGRKLADTLSKEIALIPHGLTPAKRVSAWIDTYTGKYPIIFGTRRILYYNLDAYRHIIYVEDAFATEQYQYPIKIQNLDILRAFEKARRHAITLVSSSPTLLTLSSFQKGERKTIRAKNFT